MCLAMNPDKLAPGRAVRLDLQPELRGPPGPGRAHPPRLAGGGRGHRRRRPLRHAPGPRPVKPVVVVSGRAVPLDRSDVDTDQIIPSDWLKRVERTGFGAGLFAEWRDDRDFVLNDAELRRGQHPRRRPELRHRLVARARRVGAPRLRVRGGRLAQVRRHLPQQLHEAGLVPVAGRPRRQPAAARRRAGRPDAPRSRSTWPRATIEAPAAGIEPGASRSTSSPATGCSTAGTTSGSPCGMRDEIDAYEATRAAWMPTLA